MTKQSLAEGCTARIVIWQCPYNHRGTLVIDIPDHPSVILQTLEDIIAHIHGSIPTFRELYVAWTAFEKCSLTLYVGNASNPTKYENLEAAKVIGWIP